MVSLEVWLVLCVALAHQGAALSMRLALVISTPLEGALVQCVALWLGIR